jgi:flavin-dependent dehydrogenase
VRADGRTVRVDLPHPAVVVRRVEFDHDLVAQARAAGAALLEETPLRGIEGDRAHTGAGEIRFRALVCADGSAGTSRTALGLGPGRHAHAREARAAAASQWDLVFDLDAGVSGYAWRFPSLGADGAAGETAGVFASERAPALGETLARWTEREGLATADESRYAIRLYDPQGPFGAGRALLAGEALGADPLTGEGIRYALWSGRIAGWVAARAAARRSPPSTGVYRTLLAASRSGISLAATARLAARLYGPDERWRRAATHPALATAFAAIVSGEPQRALLAAPWLAGARREPY